MLLHRYGNIDFVNNMHWIDGIELINKALEKRIEQKEWEMWVSIYPKMSKETFVSFEKFRGKKQDKKVIESKNKLTKNEIIEKAEELKKIHQGTHEGVAK